MLGIIAQEILTLFYDPVLHTFSRINAEDTNMTFHILQIGGSLCMITLHFAFLKLSSRSAEHVKLYSIYLWLLQLTFNIYTLEISVVPFQNSGNSIGAQVTFLELILLDIGFILYEVNAFKGSLLVICTYIVYICQISYIQLVLLIPYLLVNLMGVIFFRCNFKIEEKLKMELFLKCRNGEIYQSFLNLLPEGVAILMEGPNLRYANTSMQRILGCAEENMVKCLLDLKNVDVNHTLKEETRLNFDSGKVNESPLPKHQTDSSERFDKKSLFHKASLNPEEIGMGPPSSGNRGPSEMFEMNDISESLKSPSSNSWNNPQQTAKPKERTINTHKPSIFEYLDRGKAAPKSQNMENSSSHKINGDDKERSSYEEKPSERSFVALNPSKSNFLQINSPHQKNRNKYLLNLEKNDFARQQQENKNFEGLGLAANKGSYLLELKLGGSEAEPSQGSFFTPGIQGSPFLPATRKISGNLSSNPSQNKVSSYMLSPAESMVEMGFRAPSRFKIPMENVSLPKSIDLNDKKFQEALNNNDTPKEEEDTAANVLMKYAGNSNKRLLPSKTLGHANLDEEKTTTTIVKQFLKQRTEVFASAGESPINKNKIRELKAFSSRHDEIRAAYESLINRLRDEREEAQSTQSSGIGKANNKGWFNRLRKWFRKKESTSAAEAILSLKKPKKKGALKLKVDENDYCIVINSKIRNGGIKDRLLEIKLSPTFIDNKPCILTLVKDTTEHDMINRLKETDNYKNTLLASVSHELRTPLNCVISMQEELRQFIDPELIAKYLNPSINSSKLLLTLVNDILDFAQIRVGKLREINEDFDLHELLKEAIALFEIPRKTRGLEMKLDWDPKLSRNFYSDKNRINQVVVNLIGNAMKFTRNGSITVKAVYKALGRVCIMVSDTGPGIKKEDIPKIFTAFSKVDNNTPNPQGVGLGLSISQTLASRLGPRGNKGIGVHSDLGRGSCFYFTIESKERSVMEDLAHMEEENQIIDEENQMKEDETPEREDEKPNLNYKAGDTNYNDELDDDLSDRHNPKPYENMRALNKMVEPYQMIKAPTLLGNKIARSDNSSKRIQNTSPLYGHPNNTGVGGHEYQAINIRELKISSHLKIPFDENKATPINFSLNLGPSPVLSEQPSFDLQQKSYAGASSFGEGNTPSKQNLNGSKGGSDQAAQSQALSDGSRDIEIRAPAKTAEFISLKNRFNDDDRRDSSPKQKQTQYITATTHLNVAMNLDTKSGSTVAGSTIGSNMGTKLATVSTPTNRLCNCEDILIVDDNDFNLLALRQLLESLGHKVATAYNGEIAIKAVKEKKNSSCCKAFRIVFMDCDMPVMNGYEATKALKSMQKSGTIDTFPIVAATTAVNEREVNYCFECGMDAYLNKPLIKEKLKDTIKKWYKK